MFIFLTGMAVKKTDMRNVFFLIFLLISSGAVSQIDKPKQKKITVMLNNISLEEALTILSISYSVQFSYSDDVVPTQAMINLSIKDDDLASALDKLLGPYSIAYKKSEGTRIILMKRHTPLTQTIRGVVVDQMTSTPIPGATVSVQNTNPMAGGITDESGKFNIDNVSVGRTIIQITSVGYSPKTINGLLLGTGKEMVLEVNLSESVTSMDEVVIEALKNEGIPGDGVALTSGHSFTVEETKRYAGSMGDPARMASVYAGVTGPSDDNNALVIRGNSPRGVLWRVEGIEIPNPNHFTTEGASSGAVSVLSTNVLEGSDFLTGAFPAQYGNALSGVLDMRLRNGNNSREEYSIQTGLLGLEASAEGPFNNHHSSSYLVNYRYSTLSVLDKLGFELNEAGQYKDYQDISFKLNFPTQAGSFSVFGIGGKSKANRTDTTLFDNNISDVGVLGVSYKHRIDKNTFLNGSVSYSGTRISKFSEITNLPSGLLALEENYSKSYARASLSGRRRITNRYFVEGGAIMSRLNYDFFLKNIDLGNPAYNVIVNFSERDYTYIAQGFLYARQYFSPSLLGFYGFHFINFALTKDHSIEPRAGLRWQFSPRQSLSLAYGKHSRIENLQYYLARDHQSGGNEVQINRDLAFTRAHHVVLSYERTISSSHRLKLESYYQQLYNSPVSDQNALHVSINEDTGFTTDSLINKGSGNNYGVELSLDKSFSNNFYYLINASVYRSTFAVADQPKRNTAYNGNYSVHILGGKEFEMGSGRLGLNLKITSAGGRRYVPIDLEKSIAKGRPIHDWEHAFERQFPDYFRTDLQVVYKMNRERYAVELKLDIQNLTNHRNAAYYYYDADSASLKLKQQIGFLPLLSCRVEF